ncbi:MAG: GLPGLI family protein [Weeksellaceae bacterium]
MRIKLFTILFALLAISVMAQDQLKVEYEVKPYFEADKALPNMNITMHNSYYELIVDKNESNWDYIERLRNDQDEKEKGMISVSIENNSSGTLYKNIPEGIWVEDTKFDNKDYLIKDNLMEINWTISRESKTILGIKVQKATAVLDDEYKTKVTAWYAPKLVFRNGPEKFEGLPGLILELETEIIHENKGREGTTYTAIKLETLKSNKKIKVPSKGELVTSEELRAIQEASLEKMMEMYKSESVNKD